MRRTGVCVVAMRLAAARLLVTCSCCEKWSETCVSSQLSGGLFWPLARKIKLMIFNHDRPRAPLSQGERAGGRARGRARGQPNERQSSLIMFSPSASRSTLAWQVLVFSPPKRRGAVSRVAGCTNERLAGPWGRVPVRALARSLARLPARSWSN